MVESRHRGSVVGLDASGAVAFRLGDVDAPVYGRSANKPLQATAMVELGLELPPRSWPSCARATTASRRTSRASGRSSRSAGLDEELLQNTAAYPLHGPSAADVIRAGRRRAAVLQNCSGSTQDAVPRGAGLGTRLLPRPGPPAPRHVTTMVERLGGEAVAHVGIDGCGTPAHTLSLTGLPARSPRWPLRRPPRRWAAVRVAMTTHPDMVGGTGRDVTALMEAIPGLVAKDGARGCWSWRCPTGVRSPSSWPTGRGGRSRPSCSLRSTALGADTSGADGVRRTPVLGGGRPVGEAHAVPFCRASDPRRGKTQADREAPRLGCRGISRRTLSSCRCRRPPCATSWRSSPSAGGRRWLRMATKLMRAEITRPMLMRASPMANSNWSKLFLPTIAGQDRVDDPVDDRVDVGERLEGDDQAGSNGDEVALVHEVPELAPASSSSTVSLSQEGATSTRASLSDAPAARSEIVAGAKPFAVSPAGRLRSHNPFGMAHRPGRATRRASRAAGSRPGCSRPGRLRWEPVPAAPHRPEDRQHGRRRGATRRTCCSSFWPSPG